MFISSLSLFRRIVSDSRLEVGGFVFVGGKGVVIVLVVVFVLVVVLVWVVKTGFKCVGGVRWVRGGVMV